jgi:recombination protein RecA
MDKEISSLVNCINKECNDESLVRIGDEIKDVEVLSSGSIGIDKAIGVGGFPLGRLVEIYGPEACGKTTVTLNAIAEAQRNGKRCAFLDVEHALSPELARGCGVVWDDLLFAQPKWGEQAFTVAEKLINSGKIHLLVIDSVAALVPKAELEGEMDDQQMAAQARMMGKGIRKLISAINKHKCVVIFINQIREKVGKMFGSPETTPGGRALKFQASLRMEVKRIDSITKGRDNFIGNVIRVKIVKNKVAPPHKKAVVDLIFGSGVDNTKDIISIAVEYGIVIKRSSYYTYTNDDSIKGNGLDNFIECAKENDKLSEINKLVREAMKNSPPEPAIVEEESSGFDDEDE